MTILQELTDEQYNDLMEWGGVNRLSDAEVLNKVGGLGPAIVGYDLYERAARVASRTDNGRLGPALTDPAWGAKEAARVAANRAARERRLRGETAALAVAEADEDEEDDDRDPWSFVTLAGTKMLAQQHGVSYKPGTKREQMIELLKSASVVPPKPPSKSEVTDDDDDDVFG